MVERHNVKETKLIGTEPKNVWWIFGDLTKSVGIELKHAL